MWRPNRAGLSQVCIRTKGAIPGLDCVGQVRVKSERVKVRVSKQLSGWVWVPKVSPWCVRG